jgi:hypothetical protein
MKKFNHLLIISILTISSCLSFPGLQMIARRTVLPFAGGMIHGALTYKREKKSQSKTGSISGSALATALTWRDYLILRTEAQGIAEATDWKVAKKGDQQYVIMSEKLQFTDPSTYTTAAEAWEAHQYNLEHLSESQTRFIIQDLLPLFIVHRISYTAGDYAGRKLRGIVNKKHASAKKLNHQQKA